MHVLFDESPVVPTKEEGKTTCSTLPPRLHPWYKRPPWPPKRHRHRRHPSKGSKRCLLLQRSSWPLRPYSPGRPRSRWNNLIQSKFWVLLIIVPEVFLFPQYFLDFRKCEGMDFLLLNISNLSILDQILVYKVQLRIKYNPSNEIGNSSINMQPWV